MPLQRSRTQWPVLQRARGAWDSRTTELRQDGRETAASKREAAGQNEGRAQGGSEELPARWARTLIPTTGDHEPSRVRQQGRHSRSRSKNKSHSHSYPPEPWGPWMAWAASVMPSFCPWDYFCFHPVPRPSCDIRRTAVPWQGWTLQGWTPQGWTPQGWPTAGLDQ